MIINRKRLQIALSQSLGDETAQAISESIKIVPTVRIPKGTRIEVQPIVDIWFKEPVGNKIDVLPVDPDSLKKVTKN